MDIKPIGPANVGYGNVEETAANSPAKTSFPSTDRPTEAAADRPRTTGFDALAGLGRIEDLNDPEKSRKIVRNALSIIAEPELSQLKPGERESLMDWMANDPAISGRTLKLMSKVLRGD